MHRILYSIVRTSAYSAAAIAGITTAVALGQRKQQQGGNLYQLQQLQGRAVLQQAQTVHASSFLGNAHQHKNHREERFLDFASIEYEGVPYMTPTDFLESVTQEKPRHRQRRKALSKSELDRRLKKAPSRKFASSQLMRSLGKDGVISYPEYIFLLCTLANAKSGFGLAFNMIDRSRNQSIDKSEFTILNAMVSKLSEDDNEAMQDTTLMRHFFGRAGSKSLNYADFVTFMSNLQYEVLEIEFLEFSNGMPTIAESDFARVLLRYTNLSSRAQAQYVQQIKEKLVRDEGIEFEDFRLFFQFLNSLQDMATALRMYALAGHPITPEEFQRAVKACVGYTLAPRVVRTVFLLFDKDGDGNLSSDEFLGILRDRVRRLNPKPKSADKLHGDFKKCLKSEIQKESS